MISISIVGLAEVLDKIDRYELQILNGAKHEISVGLINIQGDAKQAAPVDTGRFRAGYQIDIQDEGFAGEVYNDVKYGPFLELGTRFMKAQPSLYPAFQKEVDAFPERMKIHMLKVPR